MFIKKFELYLDNEWVDITSSLDTNSEMQKRCDIAFAYGQFKAYLLRKHNIAPFTPCKITGVNNDIDYYWCASEANKYLTYGNLYVHDLLLLDLTAILECFIVSSKNFSALGNIKTIGQCLQVLKYLIEQKYKDYRLNINANEFYTVQEFTIQMGETAYSAFNNILAYVNRVIKIPSFSIAEDGVITLNIEFKRLESTSLYDYNLKEKQILSVKQTQNVDNYCYTLETEANNVIDRTNDILVENLTCRTDSDIRLTADNSKLILPAKIEKINKFYLKNSADKSVIRFYIPYEPLRANLQAFNKTQFELGDVIEGKWSFIRENTSLSLLLGTINNHLVNNGLLIDDIENAYVQFYGRTGQVECFIQKGSDNSKIDNQYFKKDVATSVLERREWDTLPINEKPKFLYYNKGKYLIENLFSTYGEDLWNSILGNEVKPFINYVYLKNQTYHIEIVGSGWDSYFTNGVDVYLETDDTNDSPLNYKYDIQYTPILDMFVKNEKTIDSVNEDAFKRLSRSFDSNSNFIDYDRLMVAMNRNNNMLGNPDLSIEYYLGTDEAPEPTQAIRYDNLKWYVASVITHASATSRTCTINLVKDYNTIAQAIGVKTQFEATKNPFENIIDRFVFDEIESNITPNVNYLKLDIYDYDGNVKTLFKRIAKCSYRNDTYYVAEAIDQYTLDTAVDNNLILNIMQDISYGFEYAEFEKLKMSLVRIDDLTQEQSYKLPVFEGNYQVIHEGNLLNVFKDARERLIFTFRIKRV